MDAGGVVIELLGSNAGLAASLDDLTTWSDTFGFTTTTMTDPEGMELQAKNALGPHHHYWVVDLETMTIVDDAATPPIAPAVELTVSLLGQR